MCLLSFVAQKSHSFIVIFRFGDATSHFYIHENGEEELKSN